MVTYSKPELANQYREKLKKTICSSINEAEREPFYGQFNYLQEMLISKIVVSTRSKKRWISFERHLFRGDYKLSNNDIISFFSTKDNLKALCKSPYISHEIDLKNYDIDNNETNLQFLLIEYLQKQMEKDLLTYIALPGDPNLSMDSSKVAMYVNFLYNAAHYEIFIRDFFIHSFDYLQSEIESLNTLFEEANGDLHNNKSLEKVKKINDKLVVNNGYLSFYQRQLYNLEAYTNLILIIEYTNILFMRNETAKYEKVDNYFCNENDSYFCAMYNDAHYAARYNQLDTIVTNKRHLLNFKTNKGKIEIEPTPYCEAIKAYVKFLKEHNPEQDRSIEDQKKLWQILDQLRTGQRYDNEGNLRIPI